MPVYEPVNEWSADEVVEWLDSIGLSERKGAFEENAVDGDLITSLSYEDLTGDLALSHIEAKYFKGAIVFCNELAEEKTKPIKMWDVDEVANFVYMLGLGGKVAAFRDGSVTGKKLLKMDAKKMSSELGLSGLQAKKVVRGVEAVPEAEADDDGDNSAAIADLEGKLEEMAACLAAKEDEVNAMAASLAAKDARIAELEAKLAAPPPEPEIEVKPTPEPEPEKPPTPPPKPPTPPPSPPPPKARNPSPPGRREPGVIGGAARGAAGGAMKGAIIGAVLPGMEASDGAAAGAAAGAAGGALGGLGNRRRRRLGRR